MIKVRIRENEKATTGRVFHIDVDVADLADTYEADVVNGWTEYGYRVWLQKAPAGKGRDHNKVREHLNKVGLPYTVTEWVKGAEDEATKMAKELKSAGITMDDLKAIIAERKASA